MKDSVHPRAEGIITGILIHPVRGKGKRLYRLVLWITDQSTGEEQQYSMFSPVPRLNVKLGNGRWLSLGRDDVVSFHYRESGKFRNIDYTTLALEDDYADIRS